MNQHDIEEDTIYNNRNQISLRGMSKSQIQIKGKSLPKVKQKHTEEPTDVIYHTIVIIDVPVLLRYRQRRPMVQKSNIQTSG